MPAFPLNHEQKSLEPGGIFVASPGGRMRGPGNLAGPMRNFREQIFRDKTHILFAFVSVEWSQDEAITSGAHPLFSDVFVFAVRNIGQDRTHGNEGGYAEPFEIRHRQNAFLR